MENEIYIFKICLLFESLVLKLFICFHNFSTVAYKAIAYKKNFVYCCINPVLHLRFKGRNEYKTKKCGRKNAELKNASLPRIRIL